MKHTKIHCLKTWITPFYDVKNGDKTFEIRKNDRGFDVDDLLVLQEYEPIRKEYTGDIIAVKVTYVIQGEFGLPEDVCVMGIERI
jgi:hypothetical protein